MSRNNNSLLSLAFLVLLCFQLGASSLSGMSPSKNTIMNAYATSSGSVDLSRDYSYGDTFYVEADLYSYPSSTSSTPGTVKMLLSIVNSETLLTSSGCMYFNSYDCSNSFYSCRNYGYQNTVVFPTFTAQTQQATSSIYMDYSHWKINNDYIYLAYSCQTNGVSLGSNRYGVIGMGTGRSGHFTSSSVFSFNISSDLTKATLLFRSDTNTFAQSSTPTNTFYTNSTWQYSFYSGSIVTSSSVFSTSLGSGNLMFDINSDVIALPYSTFKSFMSNFYFTSGVSSCGSDNYRPICYGSKKAEDLPDITLTVGGNAIKIPSKVYATTINQGSSYSFYLNFKAISPSLTDKSYVTPAFQNSIILGSRFMSYYYVVFDGSSFSNKISIYNPKTSSVGGWIAVGAFGVIFLVGLCVCIAKKKQNTSTATANVTAVNTTTFNTTQAPLVYNPVVPTTVPDYNYNVNAYNYTQQQPQGMYPTYNTGYQQPVVYNNGYVQPSGPYNPQ